MEELSKDSLTGLLSERGFREKRKRRATKGTLVLLDLDEFKQINDTLGHDAGDFALQKFGEFLKEHLRKNDFAARLHGDEFVVFLNGADESAAFLVIEHILKDLKNEIFWYKGNKIMIRASYGLCEVAGTLEEAIKCADKRMYKNKSKKR